MIIIGSSTWTDKTKEPEQMFFAGSPLEKALSKWLKRGGRLEEILGANAHQPVRSRSEAKAICDALATLRPRQSREGGKVVQSSLSTLTAFFQHVESEEAFATLRAEGLPLLRMWARDFVNGRNIDDSDAMFIMKILAMYRRSEDIDLIATAARIPDKSDEFMWSVILGQFGPDHPFANKMVDALRDPLPVGIVLVSYLDMANALAIAGKLDRHPLDSEDGHRHLEGWLRDKDEESYSYALSATAALPFITQSARAALLRASYQHPDPLVRIEAAWAEAKSGDPEGIHRLSDLCLDPRFSHTAQQYLTELGHGEEIPAETREPGFQAVAEMANWLAHPSELGCPPDAIEVFDTRELFWPPTNDTRRLYLINYTAAQDGEAEIGVGMVGSVTFALFGDATGDLSPEDVYGLHCCWELEMNGDPRAPEEGTVKAGREILARYNSGF